MKQIQVADLGELITGSTPPSKEMHLFGGDVPFLTPSDMTFDDRVVRTSRTVSADGASRFRTRLLPADAVAVVCIGATIGKICMTKERCLTNQQINSIVVDQSEYSPSYVYYLMLTMTERLKGTATGAATPILNKSAFGSLEITVPGLLVQNKIGSYLRYFDDLIENNRRRIEILEEMARLLYREWFVHFRFPGHEDVELVDSDLGPIPEGWEVAELGSVAKFVSGNAKTKAAYVDEGYTAFSASGPDGKLETYDVEGHGVVMSVVGAHCGKTFRASGRWSSIANTLKILSLDDLSHAWLYLATIDPRIWPRRGSAQPFVSINDARSVRVLVPTPIVRRRFENSVRPLFRLVDNLVLQNDILKEARDLLLPRLVSGELDVSELNLELVEA